MRGGYCRLKNLTHRNSQTLAALYTPMQFRICAEMIIGGIHASHDEPPSTTMFSQSGSLNVMKKSSSNAVVQKKVLRSSLFPRIDVRNIDREVQPKRSSFSGKMEVAKTFLCSKLSSKMC